MRFGSNHWTMSTFPSGAEGAMSMDTYSSNVRKIEKRRLLKNKKKNKEGQKKRRENRQVFRRLAEGRDRGKMEKSYKKSQNLQ